jgi:hypothetical protein
MSRYSCPDVQLCDRFGIRLHSSAVTRWTALLIALAVASSAAADPFVQNYGNFMGTTVNFVDVTESNNESSPAAALFGAPIPSGNSLDFNPISFDANATGGANDLTDGHLQMMIEGKVIGGVKQPINNLKVSEIGDTTIVGPRTGLTFTQVSMFSTIDILEVDGVPISNINLSQSSNPPLVTMFSPSNGFYSGGGPGVLNTVWTGMMFVDLNDALVKNGFPNFVRGVTKLTFGMDNKLIANSEANSVAQIAKKDSDLTIEVNIPEPATWGLLMLSAIFGAAARRRSQR